MSDRPKQRRRTSGCSSNSPVERLESRQLLSSTIYVDANTPAANAHDGASWNTAFNDLQQALAIAASGDEVHVADGTYKPTSGTDRTVSFKINVSLMLLGGYAGYGDAMPDARDVDANVTTLSGEIGDPTSERDNSFHVVVASRLTLDGFTVRNGYADYSSSSDQQNTVGVYTCPKAQAPQ